MGYKINIKQLYNLWSYSVTYRKKLKTLANCDKISCWKTVSVGTRITDALMICYPQVTVSSVVSSHTEQGWPIQLIKYCVNNSMWLLWLGRRKQSGFCLALSYIPSSAESQLPFLMILKLPYTETHVVRNGGLQTTANCNGLGVWAIHLGRGSSSSSQAFR